jgi:hypothetical protein
MRIPTKLLSQGKSLLAQPARVLNVVLARPVKYASQRVGVWLNKVSLGYNTQLTKLNRPNPPQWVMASLPYAPLLAFPTVFSKVIPNTIDRYQCNQANRQFSIRYEAAHNNPTSTTRGRVVQAYYNYVDTFGRPPRVVTSQFMNQRGVKQRWAALTKPVAQLSEKTVTVKEMPVLSRHYPNVFL